MTMARVEVITSVQRGRRWSIRDKERIVAAALEPGAVASEIARRAGIHTSQLFRWRRQMCGPLPAHASLRGRGPRAGARVRISGVVDPATVSTVISALAAVRR